METCGREEKKRREKHLENKSYRKQNEKHYGEKNYVWKKNALRETLGEEIMSKAKQGTL